MERLLKIIVTTFFTGISIFGLGFALIVYNENKNYSKFTETQNGVNNYLPQPTQTLYFEGYPCTVDCSGHEAGYNWAMENGIIDPEECSGNSQSFIEGCMSYAEEWLQIQSERDEQEYLDYLESRM